MAETYIKTYRKCLDNEIFRERPFDRWHAFEYLVLRAQRFPVDVLIKGKTVHLDTGQLIEGEENLAEKWGWSRGKVRRFITLLINKGTIAKNGTPNGTVITIENYTFYQCGEPADDTSNGTTDGTTDGTHKKKVKKEKKEKNIFVPPSVDEVSEYCRERKNNVDAQAFVDFYSSKGWLIGKNKMKDWKAAVRTWERNRTSESKPQEVKPKKYKEFKQEDWQKDSFKKEQMPDSIRQMCASIGKKI